MKFSIGILGKLTCLASLSLMSAGLIPVTAIAAETAQELEISPLDLESLDLESVSPDVVIAESPSAPDGISDLIDGFVSLPSTSLENIRLANASELEALQDDNLGQVTSVSQLSDVQPTDWAFQAVQSLVERYGCIAGYPDGTFRGNRSATRYELAAALNACLDNIGDKFATKEDLEAVRALQEEFQAELATLRGRVDGLEARTATLEAQQFSTTTKLQADVVMLAQYGDTDGGAFDISVDGVGGAILAAESRASAIASVYMSFNTSFSGNDLLQTTLSFGNGGQDFFSQAAVGTTPDFTTLNGVDGPFFSPGQNYFANNGNTAFLYRLAYDFKPTEDLTLKVAPVFYPTDIIDANSYTSPFTGFSTWYNINNPLITPYVFNFLGGAGGGFTWNPGGGPFTARGAYVAVTGNLATDQQPVPGLGQNGLFGDPYQGTAELEYADEFGGGNNNFAVRLQYTHSRQLGLEQDALGVNAEAKFGQFGVFGRYGYSFADGNGVANPVPFSTLAGLGNFNVQTFQAGVGVHDLIIPGSLLAASIGAPFLISDSDVPDSFLPGVNDQTQYNIEAFYRFPVNDNITISPIFSAIINPNNSSLEPNLYQGLIRAVFSF